MGKTIEGVEYTAEGTLFRKIPRASTRHVERAHLSLRAHSVRLRVRRTICAPRSERRAGAGGAPPTPASATTATARPGCPGVRAAWRPAFHH